MRVGMSLSASVGIAVILCGPIAAFSQASDAKTHAQEVLDQSRAALGGEEALNDIHSLSGCHIK